MMAKKFLSLVVFLALVVLPSAASASRVEIRTDDGTTIVDSDSGVKITSDSDDDRSESVDRYYTQSDSYYRRRLRRYYRQTPCRRYTSSYTKHQTSYSGRSVAQTTTSTTVCR